MRTEEFLKLQRQKRKAKMKARKERKKMRLETGEKAPGISGKKRSILNNGESSILIRLELLFDGKVIISIEVVHF